MVDAPHSALGNLPMLTPSPPCNLPTSNDRESLHAPDKQDDREKLLASTEHHATAAPTAAGGKPAPAAAPASATSERLALFCVLLSTLCFSTLSLCVHFLSERGYPSMQSASARYLLSALCSVASVAVARRGKLRSATTWLGEPRHRRLLVSRGLWGAGGMSSYFYALSHLQLGDATVLAFLNVPLTGVLGALLLKEAYSVLDGITAVTSMVGVVLVAQPVAIFGGVATSEIDPFAVVVCLFGAVTSALAYITVRQLGPSADPLVVTLYFSAVGSVVAPVLLLLFQHPIPLASWEDAGLFLVVGLFGWAGQVLLNKGIQNAPVGLATCMRYSDIIIAMVYQSTLLGSPPGWLKIGGAALIMSSIVAVIAKRRKKVHAQVVVAAPVAAVVAVAAPLSPPLVVVDVVSDDDHSFDSDDDSLRDDATSPTVTLSAPGANPPSSRAAAGTSPFVRGGNG